MEAEQHVFITSGKETELEEEKRKTRKKKKREVPRSATQRRF